ncbi:MAG: hypothetical protein V3W41_02835 [Planctomycetota bacterium]
MIDQREHSTAPDGLILVDDKRRSGPLRRTVAVLVVLNFAVVLIGTGLVDTIYPAEAPKVIGQEKEKEDERRAQAKLGDGSAARLLERDLKIASRIRKATLPDYTLFLFENFGEAKTTGVLGRDGWIFVRNRVQSVPHASERSVPLAAALISAVDRRLALVDVELTVAILPRKAVTHRDRLPRGSRVDGGLYRKLQDRLTVHGVRSVDLLSIYRSHDGPDLFRKVDTHWADEGMFVAAEAICRKAGILKPKTERRYLVKRAEERRGSGDILRLLGIPEAKTVDGKLRTHAVHAVLCLNKTTGKQVRHENPETMPRVALAGTSFSTRRRIPVYLAHFSDEEVWAGTWRALGPVEPLYRTVAKMNEIGQPTTLIWEIPAHYLFCTGEPLRKMGNIFAELPVKRIASLKSLGLVNPVPIFVPKGTLRTGTHKLKRKRLNAWTFGGRCILPGDGSVSLRLRGTLKGGQAAISLRSSDYVLSSKWSPANQDIVMPIISRSETSVVKISLGGAKGGEALDFESLELVTDMTRVIAIAEATGPAASGERWEQVIVFPNTTPAEGEAFAMTLNVKGEFDRTLQVEIRARDGETSSFELGKVLPQALIMLPLSSLAGRPLADVTISSHGKPPEQAASFAAVIAR